MIKTSHASAKRDFLCEIDAFPLSVSSIIKLNLRNIKASGTAPTDEVGKTICGLYTCTTTMHNNLKVKEALHTCEQIHIQDKPNARLLMCYFNVIILMRLEFSMRFLPQNIVEFKKIKL